MDDTTLPREMQQKSCRKTKNTMNIYRSTGRFRINLVATPMPTGYDGSTKTSMQPQPIKGKDCTMAVIKTANRLMVTIVILVLLIPMSVSFAATSEIVGAFYRSDTPFPEFLPLWYEGWSEKGPDNEPLQYAQKDMPLGGYIHLYLQNTSNQPLEVTDVLFEGVSLKEGISFSKDVRAGLHPAGIHFSKLPKAQVKQLTKAGEPVWWKADPTIVEPGKMAEVVIRLRQDPQTETVQVGVRAGNAAPNRRVFVKEVQPRIVGIGFSPKLEEVFLYLRHPKGGDMIPTTILIDGKNMTARSTNGVDKLIETVPVVIRLKNAFDKGSFHYFQAIYPDGSVAQAGIRAWGDNLVYGMWGYSIKGNTSQERVDYFLKDLLEHNINVVMHSYGNDVRDFLLSKKGSAYCKSIGMRGMATAPGNIRNPIYYFLLDEPDAQDFAARQLALHKRLGVLGQALVQRSKHFREKDHVTAHLLNIDNSFKPENWYMYGQLPDVMCADPYYQSQLRLAYLLKPSRLSLITKPTYVYGVSTICQSACAPKPLHIILNSVRHDSKKVPFRFGTPEEKRIEVYYALAAGAKGISYWWYTPVGEFHGCGTSDPKGVAMYREIGLLGAEVRTAGPVIMRSCPVEIKIEASPHLWIRCLLAGLDTLAVVVINDDIMSDKYGTVLGEIKQAKVKVTLPSWLKPRDVFEITYKGIQDVPHKNADGKITLDLGEVKVSRLILICDKPGLRGSLQVLYKDKFAVKVRRLLARNRN
ncbi:MAG: hypothetical protein ACYTF1_08530 [Planctomycetota bacterium]|jgi:hypothetical protein